MRWLVFLVFLVGTGGGLLGENLTIYCEDDPPNQIITSDGRLTGMTVEIIREIQQRVGNQDPITVVPWARGFDAVQKNPNTVLFSMSRTAERDPLFHWIGPVLETNYGFYARADSSLSITSLEEAKKLKRIGVYLNDVRDVLLTRAGFTNLDRTSNNIQNVKKVMAGRIEAYASAPGSIESEAQAAGYQASDLKELFTFMRVQLYIVLSRGTPEGVIKTWSDAFAGMQKDGSFARLHRKYYPTLSLPGKAIKAF